MKTRPLINILIITMIFLVNSNYYGAFAQKVNYLELKTLIQNDFESNRQAIYHSIKSAPNETLFNMAEQAALDNNQELIVNFISTEIVHRSRMNKIGIENYLNRLTRDNLNSDYCLFLFSILKTTYKNYQSTELKQLSEVVQRYITDTTIQSVEQKRMAIVTNTYILNKMKIENQISQNDLNSYCRLLQSIVMDKNQNSEVRANAIIGIQWLEYKNATNDFLSLISEKSIANEGSVAQTLCLALAEFKVFSAIPHIGFILKNTMDKSTFAPAAISLGQLGGDESLKLLVENENRFSGDFCGVAIRELYDPIMAIFSENRKEMLHYAVKAAKQFYRKERVTTVKKHLFALLSTQSDKELIRLILEYFTQRITRNEAIQITEKITRDSYYSSEWDFIHTLANCNEVEIKTSTHIMTEDVPNRNIENVEYADAVYRDLQAPFIKLLGHAGLCAGVDGSHDLKIIEVLNDPPEVIKENTSEGMLDGYWGSFTLADVDPGFEHRRIIMDTALNLLGISREIEYTALDALNPRIFLGLRIHYNNIRELRCDGFVEYCYEFNKNAVWGKNNRHHDISYYYEEHNDLYEGIFNNPDTELAPIVQCGRAGGTSTYMTRSSIVEVPTYYVGYTQNGSSYRVSITATDKSGIHLIAYCIGTEGNWIFSPVQPQHSISESYTFQFTVNLSKPEYIFYVAMDNAGNMPEYASWLYLENDDASPIWVDQKPANTQVNSGDVDWYFFQTAQSGRYLIETYGDQVNTSMSLYKSDHTTKIASDEDSGTGTNAQIRHNLSANTKYYVKVKANTAGHYAIGVKYLKGTPIWSEDFESGFPATSWFAGDTNPADGYDYWDDQSVSQGGRARSGYRACYCADLSDVSGQQYDDNMVAYFRLREGINVSKYSDVQLSFSVWFDMESNYDYLRRYYSVDGVNWTQSSIEWTGNSNGWKDHTVSLLNFNTYWIKFVFYTDKSYHAFEGAYIDDIQITGFGSTSQLTKANNGEPMEILVEGEIPESESVKPKNQPIDKEMDVNAIPLHFSLEQNYPNPFNPETQITFSLPEPANVNLKIFNIRGQLIKILYEGAMEAGKHSIIWDGSDLKSNKVTSGTYFYVLKAGEYQAIKRMIILK